MKNLLFILFLLNTPVNAEQVTHTHRHTHIEPSSKEPESSIDARRQRKFRDTIKGEG